MSRGADLDRLAKRLVDEASTVFPPWKQRAFEKFIASQQPDQRTLPLGRRP